MKIFSEYFNTGSIKQQNMKRLGGLLICITALLLVLAMVAFAASSLYVAIKNRKAQNPDGTGDGGSNAPANYTTTTFDQAQLANGTLLLVDDTHPYVGTAVRNEIPQGTRPVNDKGESIYSAQFGANTAMTEETQKAFDKMMVDFDAAMKDKEGYEAGYLYVMDYALVDDVQFSAASVAKIQMGTCVILNYAYKDAGGSSQKDSIYNSEEEKPLDLYKWIYENAHKYGFIQGSSVKGEESLFQYVGIAHATYMKNNNKTLAEYLTFLKENKNAANKALSFAATDLEGNTVNYRVYYQVQTETESPYVPTKNPYVVSGDNMGGYIITVNASAKIAN